MDVVATWIDWAVGVAKASWEWLAGTGAVGTGVAVLVWARKRMVGRTARAIYKHMEEKNAAVRRRRGPGEEIIANVIGRTAMHYGAHACNAGCLNRERVVGVVSRLFVERAFKRLRDDHKVVFRVGNHYIAGTEPIPV